MTTNKVNNRNVFLRHSHNYCFNLWTINVKENERNTDSLVKNSFSTMTKLIIFLAILNCIGATNFIQNKIGRLHLSNKKWEIQYILNLTEYKETTELLHECIDKLTIICERGQNSLCPYFLHETKNINFDLQTDISKLNALSRHKRFIFLIPMVMGVAFVSFWAGMYIAKSMLGSLRDNIQENLNIIEQASNITISALKIQEQYIKDADIRFSKLESSVNNNTLQIESYAQFFGIINTVLFISRKHEKVQAKLNNVYSKNVENRLFEIIDYLELLKTIKEINEKLKPNFMLPNINSMEKNNFLEIYTNINDTYLTLSIDLPVFSKIGTDISEFIPIPKKENNKLYILDMKSTKYYVRDLKIHLLPDDVIKSLCKIQGKTIICNNFLEDYTEKPSKCLENLIMHNTDVECNYKQIEHKNYFIKISDTTIFAYIVHPIKIVKNCRGKNKILELKFSHQMSLPPGCNIYKYTEISQQNDGKNTITDTNKEATPKIDLSNIQSNEFLSTIPLWDKYEIQFIEAKAKVKRIEKNIPLQRQKIDETSFNSTFSSLLPDFGIKELINNKTTLFLTAGFAILLSLLAMKSLIIRLVTNWNN